MFKPGDKVICIKSEKPFIKGQVYIFDRYNRVDSSLIVLVGDPHNSDDAQPYSRNFKLSYLVEFNNKLNKLIE